MKEQLKKSGKWKTASLFIVGIMLFASSMSFMFSFELNKEVRGEPSDFIMVNDGVFSYLDTIGYNLEFVCEINQVLVSETEKIISDKQISIISENSFGRTVFVFDLLDGGDVKFTINHYGNLNRDYWFRINLVNDDFIHITDKFVFQWESGYFDYSDMANISSFWIDSNSEYTWLSTRFLDTDDFYIDPILSSQIFFDNVNITRNDEMGSPTGFPIPLIYDGRSLTTWENSTALHTGFTGDLDNWENWQFEDPFLNGGFEAGLDTVAYIWNTDSGRSTDAYSGDYAHFLNSTVISEYVTNGGAEVGVGGDPDYWTGADERDSGGAFGTHSGSWTFRFYDFDNMEQTLSVPVPVDDMVNFTFWLCPSDNDRDVTLRVTYHDASYDEFTYIGEDYIPYDEYHHIVVPTLDSGKNITTLKFSTTMQAGAACIDDISILMNNVSDTYSAGYISQDLSKVSHGDLGLWIQDFADISWYAKSENREYNVSITYVDHHGENPRFYNETFGNYSDTNWHSESINASVFPNNEYIIRLEFKALLYGEFDATIIDHIIVDYSTEQNRIEVWTPYLLNGGDMDRDYSSNMYNQGSRDAMFNGWYTPVDLYGWTNPNVGSGGAGADSLGEAFYNDFWGAYTVRYSGEGGTHYYPSRTYYANDSYPIVIPDDDWATTRDGNQSVEAQNIWINTSHLNRIYGEAYAATSDGKSMYLRLLYTDGTNESFQLTNPLGTFVPFNWNTFSPNKIAHTLLIEGKIHSQWRGAIDNLWLDYNMDLDWYNSSDEFYIIPNGVGVYQYQSDQNTMMQWINDVRRLESGNRYSGMKMEANLSLDEIVDWEFDLNLTFNPYTEFVGDVSFAGGIEVHFIGEQSGITTSLAYINLIDNSTSLTTHQVGGSLFYKTGFNTETNASNILYDNVNYNITLETLTIKKEGLNLYVKYPDSLSFGGSWIDMGNINTIFQEGDPTSIGIQFVRYNNSRPVDPIGLNYNVANRSTTSFVDMEGSINFKHESYLYINSTDPDYWNWTSSPPQYSRYTQLSPLYIKSMALTYPSEFVEGNYSRNIVSDQITGYVNNASSQIIYEVNYTIDTPTYHSLYLEAETSWTFHNHSFYFLNEWSFKNVTLGNGSFRTIEVGFSISSYNSTHKQLIFTDGMVNGTFNWFFFTNNVVVYVDITPDLYDGLQYNITSISYEIQIANDTDTLSNYPVNIAVKYSTDVEFINENKTTGVNGWLNSSINVGNMPMLSDNEFYVCITGLNTTLLGYMVKQINSYQDFTQPVIDQVIFTDTLIERELFELSLYVADEWTEPEDLLVYFYYSEISTGSLDDFYIMDYQGSDQFYIQLAGRDAEVTMWFQVRIWDNSSNFIQTSIYQTDWIVPVAGEGDAPSGDGDGGAPVIGAVAPAGADGTFMILLFIAGGAMVAVLGYAIFRRTQVRTRRVETREVTTGFGGFGRTTETIEEKGG